jgi:hypothetical protein
MSRIYSFKSFINEQEKDQKKKEGDKKGGGLLDPGNIAQSMFDQALKTLGFEDNNFTDIADTEETKGGLPIKSCGATPYQFKPVDGTNQAIMDLFKEPDGKFSKDIRYAEISKMVTSGENKIFLVGVREDLDVKKKEGDRFTDKMILVDPSKPTEKVISYQITTSPSVVFYSDPSRTLNKSGVAIMQPCVTKYQIGTHRKGKPTEHEALIQAGEMKINRFPLNTAQIDTYKPGSDSTGADYGINIHRSSKDRGICVGPYSAGCQVFADGNDFSDFMSRIKAASQNAGIFLYALIENDDLEAPGTTEPISTTSKEEDEKLKKEEREEEKKEKKEQGDNELRNAATMINNELGGFWKNSDEDKLMNYYNTAVTSPELAIRMRSIYQEMYKKDIIDDMDRALSDSQLAKLEYK